METRRIPLAQLRLDLENPRLGRVATSDAEAQEILWEKQNSKIVALYTDIATYGPNPSDRPYVIEKDGHYVVLEGNRRLIALRALADEDSVTNPIDKATLKRIPIEVSLEQEVECDVYASRADAEHWIILKHQGPGDGEGTVTWGPEEKYRHRVATGGRRQFGFELWQWIGDTYRDRPWISDLDRAKATQWSVMQRLTNAHFRESFRFHLGAEGISSELSDEDLEPVIRKILTDINEGVRKFVCEALIQKEFH